MSLKKLIASAVLLGTMLAFPQVASASEPALLDSNVFDGNDVLVISDESLDGLYFYNMGDKKIYSYNEQTNTCTEDFAITTGAPKLYFTDGKCYYTSVNYVYDSELSQSVPTSKVSVYDISSKRTSVVFSVEGTVSSIGVDNNGRIYLSATDTDDIDFVAVYSSTGTLLKKLECDGTSILQFCAFDESNGNFYYITNDNWVYWGYDHAMKGLHVGNYDGTTLMLNDSTMLYLCQRYYYERENQAQLFDDKYLFYDSTFNNILAYFDADLVDASNITDITASVIVNRTNTDADGNFTEDAAIGVRAVYNPERNKILAFEEDSYLSEYDMDGTKLASIETKYPTYELVSYGDGYAVIEKDGTNYYYEYIEIKDATKTYITGSTSTVKVDDAIQLVADTDGTFEELFTWKSSNPKIATVTSSGKVYGWKPGTVTISATSSSGIVGTATITVTANTAIQTPDNGSVTLGGIAVYNEDSQIYKVRSDVVYSYIYENENGTLTRVQYNNVAKNILVETYDKNSGTLKSTRTVSMELPLFGGFYAGEDYNFIVYGQQNATETDDTEVLRIVKYSKSWSRISAYSVMGANTYIPFDAGSLRMTETGGLLYIHTCHEMYTSSDGFHHQANMTYVINQSDMTLKDSWYDVMNIAQAGYVSHSFNQFIQTDGENIFRVDHGDAYPRGIALIKSVAGDSITSVKYTVPIPVSDSGIGNNSTGVSIGGFELSDNNCIIVGDIISDADIAAGNAYGTRDIFISITSKDLTATKLIRVTDVAASGRTVGTPQLVKLGDNEFMLLWPEYDETSYENITKALTFDSEGNYTSDIVALDCVLSDCKPIRCSDGLVRWYTSDNSTTVMHTVNPFDMEAYNNVNTITGLTASSKTANTITLSWNRDSSVDGYIVEQYKDGTWTVISDIKTNSTTSIVLSELSPFTQYKFRVRAYSNLAGSYIYGDYSSVLTVKTIPATVTGLKLGGRAADALRVNWTAVSSADGYILQRKIDGIWTDIAIIENGTTATYRVEGLVASTTYDFRICAYNVSGSTKVRGAYSNVISNTTNPYMVSGLTIGGRAADAIRLNWKKNDSADGYIIEQYIDGSWVRLIKITNNTTLTYRVESLTPSTSYQFRVRSYNMVGTTALYGNYANISGTTIPANISGLKIGGRAADALRLNWNINTTGDGYIIEQYIDGKWVRIANIDDVNTTTYRVEGLVASTTYKFRVCAYNNVGGTVLLGNYANMSGTTNPYKTANVRIGGKAKDALRLNWDKNDTADGYIIEMYKGGKWTRVVKLTSNSTLTYRVTGLSAGTTYKLRVCSYNMVGSTALYSVYSNVTGTTYTK